MGYFAAWFTFDNPNLLPWPHYLALPLRNY